MRALLLPGSCAGQLRRFRTPNLAPHFTAISGVFQEEEKLARRSRSADRLRTYGSALFFKRLINGQKVLGVSVTSVTSVRAFLLPGTCAGQLWRFCTPILAPPFRAGFRRFSAGRKTRTEATERDGSLTQRVSVDSSEQECAVSSRRTEERGNFGSHPGGAHR